jgi:hypothetical protein
MDPLEQIIATLDTSDHVLLRDFTQRNRHRNGRLDLALIDLLLSTQPLTRDEAVVSLYGRQNKRNLESYHALRKRVYALLMEYIVSKSAGSQDELVRSNLFFARYLFDNDLVALGWKYLDRCEKLAREEEDHNVLNSIYNTYLDRIHLEGAPQLSEIEKRRALNKSAEADADRIRLALAYVKVRLKKVRLESRDLDPTILLNQVMQTYDLAELVAARPRYWFALVQLVREALVAKKDFQTLVHFLSVNKKKGAKASDPEKAQFFYFLAHAQYRAKRFPEAMETMQVARQASQPCRRRLRENLDPRLILLESAIWSFMGSNHKAVEVLSAARKTSYFQQADARRANLALNLAVFLFQENSFEDARDVLRAFPGTEKWCVKHMGLEWVLKFQLVRMIVEVDSGRHDNAVKIIRRIRRRFEDLFHQVKYQRVPLLLDYVVMYLEDEERFMLPATYEKMRTDLVRVNARDEDLQAMTYYAWLKSKMLSRDYYETLLEVTQDEESR